MNFEGKKWREEIDVRDFMFENMIPYDGDEKFLAGSSQKTKDLWDRCKELIQKERDSFGGVLDIDTETISTITSHKPGYIQQDKETIVGLQTDEPLKRGVKPFGGIRVAAKACEEYNRKISQEILDI